MIFVPLSARPCSDPFGPLNLEAVIGIAAGGVGLILLIAFVILLLVCVYMAATKSCKSLILHCVQVAMANVVAWGLIKVSSDWWIP